MMLCSADEAGLIRRSLDSFLFRRATRAPSASVSATRGGATRFGEEIVNVQRAFATSRGVARSRSWVEDVAPNASDE
jgi:hypothetical protein